MTELSHKEIDVLRRVNDHSDLRLVFFQKIKGLKWFDELEQKGFFADEKNPKPHETGDGYVSVGHWEILDYFEKTSLELNDQENEEYSRKLLSVMRSVTCYAKENHFSNYRTWTAFSKIIQKIPCNLLCVTDLEIVDYWLDDPYNNKSVCESIGKHWLPALLDRDDPHAQDLILKLVELLFKIELSNQRDEPEDSLGVEVRVEIELGREIIKRIADRLGRKLGDQVLPLFERQLQEALEHSDIDRSSVIWRPAIEEHDQNAVHPKPIDLLVDVFRDTLNAFVRTRSPATVEYVSKILESDLMTIQRIAIHAINTNFRILEDFLEQLLEPAFWTVDYKHELWNLLNLNYDFMNEGQREKVLARIKSLERSSQEAAAQTLAFHQAEWLAAIQECGQAENELYCQKVSEAGAEPDHPSFNTYITTGIIKPKAPISAQRLGAMKMEELIEYLEDFKDPEPNFFESQTQGLFKLFRQTIKFSPLRFSQELSAFDDIDVRFVHEITEAFREMWVAKKKLPWFDVWNSLLQFCKRRIERDEFWQQENSDHSNHNMIPDRHWVVGSIARLISEGVQTDSHSIDRSLSPIAREIVFKLLSRQKGEPFNDGNDAVFESINSPRGKCIRALINLTLRECRIADKTNNSNHVEVWKSYKQRYDELVSRKTSSYEATTLFANFLPNLQYMSRVWVNNKLGCLFPLQDQMSFRCAMEGYACVSNFDERIYWFLKKKGHLLKVLDDDEIYDSAKRRAIDLICVATCREVESLESEESLFNVLITRRKKDELEDAIVCLWRMGRVNAEFRPKILDIWRKLLGKLDLSEKKGQSIASELCVLVEFIDTFDDLTLSLVHKIAPYSHVEYNYYYLYEWLEKISAYQPEHAFKIWSRMLSESIPPVNPEDSVKNILGNLVKEGHEGIMNAECIADAYLKGEEILPNKWLIEAKKLD